MIRINKSGYVYVGLTLIIGFAAVNTGNNLVYLIASALLSYMLISGVFGRHNLKGVDARLHLPEEIFAGTETLIGVEMSCRRRFMPAFVVTVSIGEDQVLFPLIRPRCDELRYVPVQFEKRGRVSISEIRMSSSYPFNFFTRYRTVTRHLEFVVFPKLRRCEWWASAGQVRRRPGEVAADRTGYDSDILSIRDYVAGDALKYISWKSTAKTGALKTTELAAIEERQVVLDVDRWRGENMEWLVSCAAYWVVRLTRSCVPVGLVLDGEFSPPGVSHAHRISMLRRLALYDPHR